MRPGEIKSSSLRQAGATALPGEPNRVEPASETRALVALGTVPDPSERQVGQRYAPFLAQLVATKDQHPQTRERRRAEPSEALAAYKASAALTAR